MLVPSREQSFRNAGYHLPQVGVPVNPMLFTSSRCWDRHLFRLEIRGRGGSVGGMREGVIIVLAIGTFIAALLLTILASRSRVGWQDREFWYKPEEKERFGTLKVLLQLEPVKLYFGCSSSGLLGVSSSLLYTSTGMG